MGRFTDYRSSLSVLASCIALSALGAACSETLPEPVIASSAAEPRYAQSYPARVDGEIQAFGDGQVKVKELTAKYSGYPEALEGDVDWSSVAGIFEQADRVGRSRAYVDGIVEAEAARTFFEEEQDELTKKVGGAAHYVAKQGGCQGDEVAGAAVHALKKTVKERLEERIREANDAHRLIDGHRDGLGKKNSATLEQQVDEVTQASYLAYIALVEHKVRINRLIEEAETTKQTAEALIKAEQEYQAESGRTDDEKNASVARAEAMKKAQAGMDAATEKAKRTAGDVEQRIEASQKQQQDALTALVKSLRSKAGK
ncbi:MAG: hypothetical protein DRI90_05365 [Deltaproteobacteria bacterium]|nr:MAG: hypothetical protein DRI90_05365 [Deltaproteobacteria bacterium]